METPPFEFAEAEYPLAPLTRYRVGGAARWALLPRTLEEAQDAYLWLAGQPLRALILGGGSNVLISDKGFDGAALITVGLDGIEALGGDRYRVECGVELNDLVQDVMLPHNYEGVGGLTGIPGSVGGAMYMNAGTINGTTCQWLESAEVIGPEGSRTVLMEPSLYGYRGQTFCPPGHVILQGVFQFRVSTKDQQAVYEHYMVRRRESQPQGYCCGSVFKNPEGDHAGRLIEACGLKGRRLGGAVVSPMHANFIMNEDGATFDDITGLMLLCQNAVKERFGVSLEREVVVIE
ncbi:MAG TPA: UDP-N-acetylmuramate dehydrogenase [Candidatus Hydrogenedentes bacterium]|nr:UDP-N-acetylmuramate dehydrogenase [Candidatus Hydrogenedentota bacterium]